MTKQWTRNGERKLTPEEYEWLLNQEPEKQQWAIINLQIYGVLHHERVIPKLI
jgi:hypothetical protein